MAKSSPRSANKAGRMVFAGNDLVAGASGALAATKLFALICRLVNAAEQIVFVFLWVFAVVIVASRVVPLLGRRAGLRLDLRLHISSRHLDISFRLSHLINDVTRFNSSSSYFFHLLC